MSPEQKEIVRLEKELSFMHGCMAALLREKEAAYAHGFMAACAYFDGREGNCGWEITLNDKKKRLLETLK